MKLKIVIRGHPHSTDRMFAAPELEPCLTTTALYFCLNSDENMAEF